MHLVQKSIDRRPRLGLVQERHMAPVGDGHMGHVRAAPGHFGQRFGRQKVRVRATDGQKRCLDRIEDLPKVRR